MSWYTATRETLTSGWASAASIRAAGPGVATGGRKKVLVKGRKEPVEIMEVKGLK